MNAFLKVTTSVAQLAKELQNYNQMALHAIPTFSMSYLIVKEPSNNISKSPSADFP